MVPSDTEASAQRTLAADPDETAVVGSGESFGVAEFLDVGTKLGRSLSNFRDTSDP